MTTTQSVIRQGFIGSAARIRKGETTNLPNLDKNKQLRVLEVDSMALRNTLGELLDDGGPGERVVVAHPEFYFVLQSSHSIPFRPIIVFIGLKSGVRVS